jgi:hypothetical protein
MQGSFARLKSQWWTPNSNCIERGAAPDASRAPAAHPDPTAEIAQAVLADLRSPGIADRAGFAFSGLCREFDSCRPRQFSNSVFMF